MSNRIRERVGTTIDPDLQIKLKCQRIHYSEAIDLGAAILTSFNSTKEGEIVNEIDKANEEIKRQRNRIIFLEKQLTDLKGNKSKEETEKAKKRLDMAERINQGIKMNNPVRDL